MELGWIGQESLPVFRSLLLPQVAEAMERKEAVTALGIAADRLAVGALACHIEGERCVVDSLYVAPDYRRQGGGRMLLEGLKGLLTGGPAVHGIWIDYTATLPEHEAIGPFLTAMGFSTLEDQEENIYFTTLSHAADSAFFGADGGAEAGVLPFAKIPRIYLSMAGKRALQEGVPLPQDGLDSPEMERDVSTGLVRDKAVQAFVAFDHSCCGHLTLSCAWSGGEGPAVLAGLLKQSYQQAREKYPAHTPLAVQAVTPTAAALIRKLLPGARPISHTCVYQLEEGA